MQFRHEFRKGGCEVEDNKARKSYEHDPMARTLYGMIPVFHKTFLTHKLVSPKNQGTL